MRITILASLFSVFITSVNAQKNMELFSISGIPHNLHWDTPPLNWKLAGDSLIVTAGGNTDLFLDPRGEYAVTNSPRALFACDEYCLVSSRVDVDFSSQYDAGVLLVYGSPTRWAKLCFELSPQGNPTIVSVVNNGVSDDANAVAIEGRQVYLRIARLGAAFAFHYSTDGRYWHLVRYFSLGEGPAPSLGFSSQSPTGESCTSVFSEIHYQERKLEDLRNGQ